MSLISIAAVPVQAFLPAAGRLAQGSLVLPRGLVGLGAFFTSLMIFKPTLNKLQRSIASTDVGKARATEALRSMANDLEATQPGQASDLRALAARF